MCYFTVQFENISSALFYVQLQLKVEIKVSSHLFRNNVRIIFVTCFTESIFKFRSLNKVIQTVQFQ